MSWKRIRVLLIIISFIAIIISAITIVEYKSLDKLDYQFGENTIYTTGNLKDELKNIEESEIKFDTTGSIEQKLFKESLSVKSIKDLEGVKVNIDLANNKMVVKSSDNDTLKRIYDSIYYHTVNRDAKYNILMSQFKFNDAMEIENMTLDDKNMEIVIQAPDGENIDEQIVFMDTNNLEAEGKEDENTKNEKALYLIDIKNSNYSQYNTVIFKPEAIYGKAITQTGLDILSKIKEQQGKIWTTSNNTGLYQSIGFDNVIESLTKSSNKTDAIKALEVDSHSNDKSDRVIRVYFEDEAKDFEAPAIELIESLGYSVELSNDVLDCDLSVGYTWIFVRGIQSSLDKDLDDTISKYCLTGETEGNIGFMFRTAWALVS